MAHGTRCVLLVDVDEYFVQVARRADAVVRDAEYVAVHQHGDVVAVSHAARARGVEKHMSVAAA
eukprot:CAMPEP_0198332036 /NCGR_PEP_ID=MMETSP1450-20131203/18008_1 /TAXON_ID=753684 ORGANISM="Madagascaria erythrocladiodes, Strain CCMP3234" /NCGR_SAMPLE_ID=MMETSP1450 /ASSEMBLY_ACC=CAM_ASM_001115 /LENGTH=63 /DNA_ID=CAMNT_0044036467 /DNA_START=29 /DNA_END=216 /DNA_ORIENTATION=+